MDVAKSKRQAGEFAAFYAAALDPPGDPIEWSGGISAWGDESWIDVVGRAPGADRVEIVRTDGVVVEASVHSPIFAAWWPGKAWIAEIRALGADGQVVANVDSFPPAHWSLPPGP